MPIGAMGTAGRQVFPLVRRLHDELGVNTTCGASNVSFGLPNRNGLNGAFLSMAIANGMTCAITSPLHEEVRAGGDGGRRADGQRRGLRRVDPPLRRGPAPAARRGAGAEAARGAATRRPAPTAARRTEP